MNSINQDLYATNANVPTGHDECFSYTDHSSKTPCQKFPLVPVILGIGTANPDRVVSMEHYARNFGENFKLSELQIEFADRICKSAKITKKHLAIPFERYAEDPNLYTFGSPSLDTRIAWYETEATKIAEMVAVRTLESWGGEWSSITHLIVYSTSGTLSPGIDLRLIKALRLSRSTKHFWVSLNGCHAGIVGMRTAAEIGMASSGNRILVVWVEINSCQAQGPDPKDWANNIVVASIFGDGAGAVVIGTQPLVWETPIYEIHRCKASYVDGSGEGIVARITQAGLYAGLAKNVPQLVGEHVQEFVLEMLGGTGLRFEMVNWALHPGGRAIVDVVEESCKLRPHQLQVSRKILDEYSNMGAPTIVFVLDMMRKERRDRSWTLALAFGPGICIEGALLKLV